MAVKIGPDGSIIKDDEVISSGNGTVIRDDGTIESTNIGGSVSAPQVRYINTPPPVSPLENRVPDQSIAVSPIMSDNSADNGVSARVIAEKEYDLQMQEAKIRGAFPKQWVIVTCVLCGIAAMGPYFLFIPAVITGIMIMVGLSKKSELETEREQMKAELEALKGRNEL